LFVFNNENFQLGRKEKPVKVHCVILGRREVKKKGIVGKSS